MLGRRFRPSISGVGVFGSDVSHPLSLGLLKMNGIEFGSKFKVE